MEQILQLSLGTPCFNFLLCLLGDIKHIDAEKKLMFTMLGTFLVRGCALNCVKDVERVK